MAKEVREVFHMKKGTDETSYGKSSYIQKEVHSLTKSIKEEAIRKIYSEEQPLTLCIADLGCASTELNNNSVVYELLTIVEEARRKLGHGPQDYQVYLNDLPGNDFNTVFRSLPRFQQTLTQQMGDEFGHCFISGVPGSFYDNLFPSNSLHFVHSSYSLHWLSQVPEGIDDNKRNICIAKTSPPSVVKAYYEQFEKNFLMFLQCRSKEMKPGGGMVLTLMGRDSNESCTKKAYYAFELLTTVLNGMVEQGHIAEEKLNSFNMPYYPPTGAEIRLLVEKEGSFTLNQVHVFEVPWARGHNDDKDGSFSSAYDHFDFAKSFSTCVRSVVESLMVAHFGDGIIDEVFRRYQEIVHVAQAKEKNVWTNITVMMTRKG